MRSRNLLLALALVAPWTLPDPVLAYESPHEEMRGLRDRLKINVGGFFPNFDTQIRLDSTNLFGSIIRLESNLNLDESTSNYRLEGHWRFSPRSRIEFAAFDIRRDSDAVISAEIVIPEDTTYLVGARVETEFDTSLLKASYKWSFFNNGKVDTGFTAGLSILDANLGLDAVGGAIDDMGNPVFIGDGTVQEGFTFPVPVFGQFIEMTLRKRLFYRAGYDLFLLNFGDWKGSVVDLKMSLDYYFNRTVGIGLGYNYVSIEYEEQTGSPRLDVEYTFSGAMAYLSFVF